MCVCVCVCVVVVRRRRRRRRRKQRVVRLYRLSSSAVAEQASRTAPATAATAAQSSWSPWQCTNSCSVHAEFNPNYTSVELLGLELAAVQHHLNEIADDCLVITRSQCLNVNYSIAVAQLTNYKLSNVNNQTKQSQ